MFEEVTEECQNPIQSKEKGIKYRIFSTFYKLQMSFIPSDLIHTIIVLIQYLQLIAMPISLNTTGNYWQPLSLYAELQSICSATYDPLSTLDIYDSIHLYVVSVLIGAIIIVTAILCLDFILQFLKPKHQFTMVLSIILHLSSTVLFLPLYSIDV